MRLFHRSRDKDGPQAVPKHHSKLCKFCKKFTGAKSGPDAKSGGSAEPVVPTEDLSNLHLGGTNASSLKQDTGERLIETAQPNDTESCAPPFQSAAAAAKATRPGTDARVPDDHQPPAALQALPPDFPAESAPKPSPTESTEQPTPLLSVSERLWNAAYDSLETVDAELVVLYMKTLESVLGGGTRESSATDLSAKLKDPPTRQTYLRDLLEKGQQKISRVSKLTTGVGKVADFILSAKKMVDLVLQSVPQAAPAALPWAGVCLGLEILRNPAQATRSNLAGITHVISRMDWFCALTKHLLNKNNISTSNDFQAVLHQLEGRVTELYKALLLYQMKSVCSYYRNQGLVFLRNMVSLDDWDGDLKLVTDAEAAVQNDATQYFQEHAKSSLGELVKHAQGMEKQLGDIHQDIQDFISLQKDARREDIESACLRDLHVVDPQDDMQRIEKNKDKLLGGAYKWILRTSQYAAFTNWDDSGFDCPPSRLLWIKGQAGMGKTMLMIGLIRQLAHRPAALAPGLSFFFCQGTDTDLNNATAVLRSLIWLLLLQQPHLISHLVQKYKNSGADLFKDKNSFIALSEAFRNMLKDPQMSPVYLAVDALDECVQGRSDLIRLISTSLKLSQKVRWLLSSRPEVFAELKDCGIDSSGISKTFVELDAQRLAKSVNAYIDHKLAILKDKAGYSDSILTKVSKEVHKRAENTFLWVALAFKILESKHGEYAVKRIREMPPGLSKLYDHMMTRIEEGQVIEPQDCKTVLVVASLAFRPLSILELSVLADLELTLAEKAIEMCGSFLTITKGTVNLIHQSAKDYLEKNYESRLRQAGPSQGHSEIVRRSIDAMSKLKRNMYNLDLSFKPENMTPPDPDPLAPIRYSCVFWVDHLCSLSSDNSRLLEELTLNDLLQDNGVVYRFLNTTYLYWLEALSLLQAMSEGVVAIRKLEDLLGGNNQSQLSKLAWDACRFALSNKSIIEQAPLQAYISALVFAPRKSLIKRNFSTEEPEWIQKKPAVELDWNACLQTLEGHSNCVVSVAFSPDGQRLASGSRDNTIKIWDPASGSCLQTLGHSDHVDSVAFSPDGRWLASGSWDNTIKIWDPASGSCLQTLEGHSNCVVSVAFSPDGRRLASGSEDNTIKIWDPASESCLQTLEGHSHYVYSIAFSPDGRRLASGSRDNTIKIWDPASESCLQTLEGHSHCVVFVAFSPDGRRLASGSWDNTIKIWDLASGSCLQTLGHSSYVDSVTFSPDGQRLASGSEDKTIKIWDPASESCLQTLEGHSHYVDSVAFSLDGRRLASGSRDNTIKIWDPASESCLQTLEGHSHWVLSVAFSPDGQQLASGSWDNTIKIWDLASRSCLQTFEGHSNYVYFVAFSPDGQRLASGSGDTTIKVWDPASESCLQTLEGHSNCVVSVAFSPDGQRLASGSWDNTIKVWDPASESCLQNLEGHSNCVVSVAFSPDGQRLASGSRDNTIKIWDPASGSCLQTIPTSTVITNISFGSTSRYLHTNIGRINIVTETTKSQVVLDNSESHGYGLVGNPESHGYGLGQNESWITFNGQNVLWLPPNYRPVVCNVQERMISIGCASGLVWFIGF